jgi:hypothetical protein
MNDFKVAAVKPTISFAEPSRLDIRVGMIERVEDVLAVPEKPVPNGARAG